MGAAEDDARSARSVERTETFSDAVLAIIITLLVLDLKPPQIRPGHLLRGLLEEWPAYLAYATSFLNLAAIWLAHRYVFERIRATSPPLNWANLAILFSSALVPFPTAVVARFLKAGNQGDIQTAIALYALVGALMLISAWIFYQYAVRHPELIHAGGGKYLRQERTKALIGTALFLGGGLFGYVSPWIAFALFLAVPLYTGITTPR